VHGVVGAEKIGSRLDLLFHALSRLVNVFFGFPDFDGPKKI
jgi:hypothetical protein